MAPLFLAPPLSALWAGKDVFVEVEALPGVEYRAVAGRRTFRTEIEGRGYFVKIHRGVGWLEIFKNLLSLRLPVLGARNEYEAIRQLEALGVATMHAVGFGERGSDPARRHSFLITEELAPTQSLDLAWPTLAPAARRALTARVAQMTRRMHSAGLNHRDLYLCHFLLHTDAPPAQARLSLIDLHRAQSRERVPRRWRDKDLAALYYSARAAGVSRHDSLRFLRGYFGLPLRAIFASETRLLRFLVREATRLDQRYTRKYFNQISTGAST
ncbi:MAG: lipopolysaccharide core heptose(I) kinase RfaP [Rhodocyclaceae bacterium]|nr:lipopolysaccharide core heptose(I) kinase RfaP [Rhodocyclaceae bacterium]